MKEIKIKQIMCHQETGIGTYTLVGLGEDNKVYEWQKYEKEEKVDGEWMTLKTPRWELRE